MSPFQIAEGDPALNQGVKEQIKRLGVMREIIQEESPDDEEEDGYGEDTDVEDTNDDDLASVSSGPSFHDNLNIVGLINNRPDSDEDDDGENRVLNNSCR